MQLHYYFEDEHHVLLLLEYASGGSLFSLLRRALGSHDHRCQIRRLLLLMTGFQL